MEVDVDWRTRRSTVWPEVCYEIRPLRVWAFQALLAYWEDAAPDAAAGSRAAGGPGALAAATRMMDVARRIFPEHVRNVTGLRLRTGDEAVAGSAGSAGSADTGVPDPALLCEAAPLLPLAAEIVGALVEISALDAGAEKN